LGVYRVFQKLGAFSFSGERGRKNPILVGPLEKAETTD
jgi:hypothetical protein